MVAGMASPHAATVTRMRQAFGGRDSPPFASEDYWDATVRCCRGRGRTLRRLGAFGERRIARELSTIQMLDRDCVSRDRGQVSRTMPPRIASTSRGTLRGPSRVSVTATLRQVPASPPKRPMQPLSAAPAVSPENTRSNILR